MFKNLKQLIINKYQILIVFISSLILRLINLHYSDYQGDEIKALYLPQTGDTFFSYLMDQRKGPVQFIITFLLKYINPTYSNEFLIRLPFALAGIFAVVYFYKFLEIHFGKKIAFYSALLMSTNGFFVAFSRIVQYQSFTILFMILALYNLSRYKVSHSCAVKGLISGFLFWALSILSHYDGIFILPFVFYLVIDWFKNSSEGKKSKIKILFISLLIPGILLLSFYIPFIMYLSDNTLDYWMGRITGDVSGKISSSKYLFTVYQPIYVIHIYTFLFIFGMAFIFLGLVSSHIKNTDKMPKMVKGFLTHTTDLMNQINSHRFMIYSLLAWLGVGVIFFEFLVYIPGTHIYNYLVPLFVILAYGLVTIESFVFKVFEYQIVMFLNILGMLLIFSFLFFQGYAVFVDNYREYPWEDEKFLIWTFPRPTPAYHLSMFGFPYYRNWEGIRDFVKAFEDIKYYSTNERKSIVRHYVSLDKDTDQAGFYVYVKNPQSFENDILHEKAKYWADNYEPVHTLSRYGRDLVRVYIMEPGTIEDIQSKGY